MFKPKKREHMQEVAIVFLISVFIFLLFFIDLDQETYHGDESLHISRGIKAINLIIHGDIRADEWGYYITNEGKIQRGFPITPANVIIGIGPRLIGVRSGGWAFNVKPPDQVLVSARAMVVVFGVMTCVILFYLGRALGGFRTGLSASLLLALNPLWLVNARLAMRDTPSAFFSTISVFLFYYGIKKEKFKVKVSLISLSSVTNGLAIGSKQLAGVASLTISLYLLMIIINEIRISRKMRLSKNGREALIVLFIFVTLSFLVYVASIPYQWKDPNQRILRMFTGGAFSFTEKKASKFANTLKVPGDILAAATGIINIVLWPIYSPTLLGHFPTCLTWFGQFIPCYSTLPATVLFFIGLGYLAIKGIKKKLSQIETLSLMWFSITLVGLSWWIPILWPRYILQLIPSVVLIEAIGLSYLFQKMRLKIGYFFSGVALITHTVFTLMSFPEYRSFRLQRLFVKDIGLILTAIFILSLFCVTILQIRFILHVPTVIHRKHLKSLEGEKHEKN